MREVRRELRQRMRDILAYVRILQFTDKAVGPVSLQARNTKPLAVRQNTIHVLKAGVFLHLYNLVESTVALGLAHVTDHIKTTKTTFHELEESWQKAWAVSFANLEEDMGAEKRLAAALRMCRAVAEGTAIEIKPKISGGNLDDVQIARLMRRYGIRVDLRDRVGETVTHKVKNDSGFLSLIKQRRNGLAHGEESFADVGKDYTTAELVKWSWATYQYLKDLLRSFEAHLASGKFRRLPQAPPA
jgi:MAE_28990/MAE_18760-like HEPN